MPNGKVRSSSWVWALRDIQTPTLLLVFYSMVTEQDVTGSEVGSGVVGIGVGSRSYSWLTKYLSFLLKSFSSFVRKMSVICEEPEKMVGVRGEQAAEGCSKLSLDVG